MFELLDQYGFLAMMITMVVGTGIRFLYIFAQWERTRISRISYRQYIWATRPKPKQKRKRTPNAPEKRYFEALKAIADREQRPHILHEGEMPSDIAQMRDLAHQRYLRECAERNTRQTARPIALVQGNPQ